MLSNKRQRGRLESWRTISVMPPISRSQCAPCTRSRSPSASARASHSRRSRCIPASPAALAGGATLLVICTSLPQLRVGTPVHCNTRRAHGRLGGGRLTGRNDTHQFSLGGQACTAPVV